MGYELKQSEFRVQVLEDHIRAKDLVIFMGAANALYEALAAVFYFGSEPFENDRLKSLPDDAALRVTKLWSGSDVTFSLLGIDKAIEAFRKVVEDIRFRKERRKQEEAKTAEKTDQTP